MIEQAKLEDKEEIYNLICILENKEINIVAYLDNNINKCGRQIDNVYIFLPD